MLALAQHCPEIPPYPRCRTQGAEWLARCAPVLWHKVHSRGFLQVLLLFRHLLVSPTEPPGAQRLTARRAWGGFRSPNTEKAESDTACALTIVGIAQTV